MWVRLDSPIFDYLTASFNSRTRVGATAWLQWDDAQASVSIHAPVWVRLGPSGYVPRFVEFQFTHPCGCDITRAGSVESWAGFNSRTRVGATKRFTNDAIIYAVSIHAPVWVRPRNGNNQGRVCCFNSRTRVGATRLTGMTVRYGMFQFTHPCGCDRPWWISRFSAPRFNSRTRVGATILVPQDKGASPVSIHAPVWVRQV